MGINQFLSHQRKQVDIFPLIVFRIGFGLIMIISIIRFYFKGWIHDFYVAPSFHFPFFDWVQVLPEPYMYGLFLVLFVTAFFITLGLFYRLSTILFFIVFTYIELIDKTWYLNHYYFVSLVIFLLIFLPANKLYSLDVHFGFSKRRNMIPLYLINIIRLQLGIVYFFAGIAKIKYDWLILGEPIKTWLAARSSYPILGKFVDHPIFIYSMAWSGMLYDLLIPFILSVKKSRGLGYVFVIVFHFLTYWLFNIGMFPWIMIVSTLVFFDGSQLRSFFKIERWRPIFEIQKNDYKIVYILIPFFIFQTTFPLRHFMYPGKVQWTEQGLRFAWHVMIMEKNGFTEFQVVDKASGKKWIEYPQKNLCLSQEKQMSFQPDMILQYAHFLKKEYEKKGYNKIEIYVDNRVSLNGRPNQHLVPKKIDLTTLEENWRNKSWLVDLKH